MKIILASALGVVAAVSGLFAITFSDQVEPFRLKHEEVVQNFKQSQGFGLSRMAPRSMNQQQIEVTSQKRGESPLPRHEDLMRDWQIFIRVKVGSREFFAIQYNLVSLLKQKEALVYAEKSPETIQKENREAAQKSSDHPARKSHYAPRPLTADEQGGLGGLLKGSDFVNLSGPGTHVFIGAIRADATCLKCHEDHEKGDLLGAFLYEYREQEILRQQAR